MYDDKGQMPLRCTVLSILQTGREPSATLSVCLFTNSFFFYRTQKKKKDDVCRDVCSVFLVCLRRPQRDAIHVTFNASLLQGKSVSLTNFFRIARNTMTMCFNKEPGAAEVEVSADGSGAAALKCC